MTAPSRHANQWLVRLLTGALAVLVMIVMLAFNQGFREAEASVVRSVISPFTKAFAVHDVVVIGVDTGHPVGLRITNECTASLLVLPSLVGFCLYILFLGVRIRSAAYGLLMAGLIAFIANQLRLFFIAVSWLAWGPNGLWVAHILVGSIISLLAVFVTLMVQIRLTASKGHALTREY
jgi:exosortase/archaeosortase family protein